MNNALLFAQTPVPVEIASWLACAAFILMMINGAMKLVDRVKDKPAAGEVQRDAADRYVPKELFTSHVTENREVHDQIFSKIGGVERGAKSAIEGQVEVVRKDVAQCGRDIAGLKVETQLQNQSLARVESKLDRLIERP